MVVVVHVAKGFELSGGLAADDLGFGVDAGFEGVHTTDGFAGDGVRSGGFLRIQTIGCDLFDGGHRPPSEHRVTGEPAGEARVEYVCY